MKTRFVIAATLIFAGCGGSSEPEVTTDTPTRFTPTLVPVAETLDMPWSLTFIDDGAMLVSEKSGHIQLIRDGQRHEVTGGPDTFFKRQGGYLDIEIDPAFVTNRLVYLAYSWGNDDANGTAVWRGRLSDDEAKFEDTTQIFQSNSERSTAAHYGGRLLFLKDDTLLLSIGEGFRYMDEAQNTANHHGTIVRMNTDGSFPSDNPFADDADAAPGIYTYGHRNEQGLAYDAANDIIYESEHGPKGGDEINILAPGTNYGWPVITYGVNYDGTIISSIQEKDGMAQPITFWVPSIAPSGLAYYTGDKYPGWTGDLFSGALDGPAGQKIVRIDLEDGKVVGREDLFAEMEEQWRDVVQGPDGYLYLVTNALDGVIYRIEAGSQSAGD